MMEGIIRMRRIEPPAWARNLAPLLPLWLIAISISMGLIFVGWMPVEIIPYSLVPLVLLSAFDEISASYKTPFIRRCALILTAGLFAFQRSHTTAWRMLILALSAAIPLLMAAHAVSACREMAKDLGYGRRLPDAHGCPPLTEDATAWWALFFKL